MAEYGIGADEPVDALAPGEPFTPERGYLLPIAGTWIGLSIVVDLLFWFLAGPHMPPGRMTSSADGAQFDFNVLMVIVIPVLIGVWTYGAFSIYYWRASRDGSRVMPEATRHGHLRLQSWWIGVTTVTVLGVFLFGTIELVVPAGAGGGEGANPVWTPNSKGVLPIQVIGQQWKFTYRYPTFGGFESDQLVIPKGVPIAFHVTSLDVIHDFWAYQLGVKADANPGSDNVAYTTANQTGQFVVRCDELCGLWHGSMYNYGVVMSKSSFVSWAQSDEARLTAATKLLPAFAYTYTPDANGADGGFYTDTQDPYSTVEQYGAQPKGA